MSTTPRMNKPAQPDHPESPRRTPPPYQPPAIELRMPLETTAAFCDTAMNGKELPLCTGPINS